MRAVAASAVAILLVLTTLPAEAKPEHPLPKTEKATRELVRDVLVDVDSSAAKTLQSAQKLVRKARAAAEDATPPLPGLPVPAPSLPDTRLGALEVRATLVQPGVYLVDQTIGAMWLGASEGRWTGAYWVETNGVLGVSPSLIDMDELGIIMFLDSGYLARSSIDVTYHFLGFDGSYTRVPLGEIAILDEMPVLERADVGGAAASVRGKEPEAILVTPWNLFDRNMTIGMTIYDAQSGVLDDITGTACEDAEASHMEPGCRLLYILPFSGEVASLSVWHLDEAGERVDDRTLTRAELTTGYVFRP